MVPSVEKLTYPQKQEASLSDEQRAILEEARAFIIKLINSGSSTQVVDGKKDELFAKRKEMLVEAGVVPKVAPVGDTKTGGKEVSDERPEESKDKKAVADGKKETDPIILTSQLNLLRLEKSGSSILMIRVEGLPEGTYDLKGHVATNKKGGEYQHGLLLLEGKSVKVFNGYGLVTTAIEELLPEAIETLSVELAFSDGEKIVGNMSTAYSQEQVAQMYKPASPETAAQKPDTEVKGAADVVKKGDEVVVTTNGDKAGKVKRKVSPKKAVKEVKEPAVRKKGKKEKTPEVEQPATKKEPASKKNEAKKEDI